MPPPGIKRRSYRRTTSTGATPACDDPQRDESRPQSQSQSHPPQRVNARIYDPNRTHDHVLRVTFGVIVKARSDPPRNCVSWPRRACRITRPPGLSGSLPWSAFPKGKDDGKHRNGCRSCRRQLARPGSRLLPVPHERRHQNGVLVLNGEGKRRRGQRRGRALGVNDGGRTRARQRGSSKRRLQCGFSGPRVLARTLGEVPLRHWRSPQPRCGAIEEPPQILGRRSQEDCREPRVVVGVRGGGSQLTGDPQRHDQTEGPAHARIVDPI